MKKYFFRPLALVMSLVLLSQTVLLDGMVATAAVNVSPQFINLIPPELEAEEKEPAVPVSEDTSLRTADSKHFLNNDNSYSALIYSQPVHYQDAAGDWTEIDNTLVDMGDYYAPKASGAGIFLPKDLDKGKVTLSSGKYALAIDVHMASLSSAAPEIDLILIPH